MSGLRVSLRVVLEVDDPRQERVFEEWAQSSRLDVGGLKDEGCGCCVNIYQFSVPYDKAAELGRLLREVGVGVEYLGDTL